MKKYDQYKNSGVEWLGEIPEHWEIKRFKHISNIQKGKLPKKIISTNDGNLPPYMSMEYLRGGEENQWVFDKDAKIIDENKTLLLWDGSNAGEFIKSRKGVISSTVAEIEFKYIHNNFAWYYSKFLEIEIRKKTIGMGIPHVNGTELKNFSVAIPPKEEQTAIAHFLDDKNTKIDQAIAIKQQQIELLKERRQILIHKAVTRGLNDKVKLKDSGVEWIGEIPEHWELSRLKNHINMITGFPFKSEKYTEEGIKLARGINVKEGVLNWKETRCWPTVENHLVDYLLKDGDILIAMDGSKVGKNFCQVKESDLPILLLQRVARLRTKHSLLSNFLYAHIVNRNFLQWVEMTKTDPMVPHIAPDDIKNFQVTIPPLEEQKQIVEFIETATNKITTAISLKEQEIDKLKEYKMSLIDGVVTGKAKVC